MGWILFRDGPKDIEELPWWRVINNEGRISIKNPKVSPTEQKQKLEQEDIEVSEDFKVDIEKYRWRPSQEILDSLKLDDEYVFSIIEKYGI